ncbi:MAG: FAD-dependent oxidoreductase [Methylocystaceae bacterium]
MGKKVVIVGGVAGGASAAARLRRLDESAEIIMLERGADISFANCGLPYYVGGVIPERQSLLVQTPAAMRSRFNIDVRTLNEVVAIIPEQKRVVINDLSQGTEYQESYDYLMLCPGAAPIIPDLPGIEGENVFVVRNIPDSDRIKQYVEKNRSSQVVVLGGGFIGLEMAEMMLERGLKVALVEASSQVMGSLDPEMASILHATLRQAGVNLRLGNRVTALDGSPNVTTVMLDNGERLAADLIILGAGVRPESKLAREAGLTVGERGGIKVNEFMQTSDPWIYAAGDAVEVKDLISGEEMQLSMASPANRQGWIAANNIAGIPTSYNGVQGTAILRFRHTVVAATGRNEKSLQRQGIPHLIVHTHPSSHATYYPGASQMTIKLLFAPGDGRILGAQIVGQEGVDKRIDVLATAVRNRLTVHDLQELELAYAPPFSSAKDPVNMTAYAASNILQGLVEVVYWPQVKEKQKAGALLLDARTRGEFERGAVPGAVNIPVDDLRQRMDELPKDREIMVYCGVGLRSYIANRILCQNGFPAKNISGGYRLYQFMQE